MAKELTEKQKKFCEYYTETGKVQESALKAGYAPSTAKSVLYRYLKTPQFKEYLSYMKSKKAYNFDKYLEELDIALQKAIESDNPAVILKIIEKKEKLFGFDKITLKEQVNKQKKQKNLFKEIEEQADVFRKTRQSNSGSDLPEDNR